MDATSSTTKASIAARPLSSIVSQLSAASTEARGTQWEMGIPKILKAPWGHGAGTGGDTLGFLSPIGIQTIDTYYLTIGLEYGVIGFVVYYGMLVASTYYAAKYAVQSPKGELSYFMPAAIALVNFIVIKSVFSQQDNHPLIFMLMGIVTAMVYRATRENPDVAARSGA